jgi:hypothetical protein
MTDKSEADTVSAMLRMAKDGSPMRQLVHAVDAGEPMPDWCPLTVWKMLVRLKRNEPKGFAKLVKRATPLRVNLRVNLKG